MSDFDLVLSGRVILTEHEIPNGFIAIRVGGIALTGEGRAAAARRTHPAFPDYLITHYTGTRQNAASR